MTEQHTTLPGSGVAAVRGVKRDGGRQRSRDGARLPAVMAAITHSFGSIAPFESVGLELLLLRDDGEPATRLAESED